MVSMSTVGADRAGGDRERLLGAHEGLVPERGLSVALQLRQVEVGAAAALQQLGGVVEDVEAEVEEAGRDGLAIHQQVPLGEVPAARADDEGGDLVVKPVLLAFGAGEGEAAAHGVDEVRLT